MSKSLSIRLRAAIFSPGMLVSICIGISLLMWHTLYTLLIYNLSVGPLTLKQLGSMYLNDIYNSHARSGFDLFAPVLAVLPASTIFCEDYSSGYIKSILGRVDQKRYLRETIVCSSISGGLAVLIPSLFTSLLFISIGEPNLQENLRPGYSTFLDESIFADIQFIWGGILVIVILLVLAFIFGAIWSNVGLCISTFIPNRYIALAAPFALYFAIHLIFYRLKFLLPFSPVNMVMPVAIFIPNLLYPFLYQSVLLLLFAFMFRWNAERRLGCV